MNIGTGEQTRRTWSRPSSRNANAPRECVRSSDQTNAKIIFRKTYSYFKRGPWHTIKQGLCNKEFFLMNIGLQGDKHIKKSKH